MSADPADLSAPSRQLTRALGVAEVAMIGTLVLALAVALVAAVAQGWTAVSDDALIELAVRDVPANLPLTGVYSRYGWSHPGPLMFYLLAVPYRLLGSSSTGLVVGALAGQFLAVLATWWTARRLDRVTALVVLTGCSAVLVTTGATAVRDPWNPHVGLIGSGFLVVLAWSAACRSRIGLVALWSVGSLLVQSHVATAPFVALTSLTAVLLAVGPWPADGRPVWDRSRVRWAMAGVGLAALCWLPAVVQQLTGDPGNLGELAARRGTGTPLGIGTAAAALSQAFGAVPSVLDPRVLGKAFAPTVATVPWWLLFVLAGVVLALRRRDRLHLRGLTVGTGALIGALVGIASVSDALYSYLVVWNRSLVVTTVALAAGALLAAASPRVLVASVLTLGVVGVGANLTMSVQQARASNPQSRYAATVDALAKVVGRSGLSGTLAIDPASDIQASDVAAGLLAELERQGVDVTSTTFSAARIGGHRKLRVPDHVLLVAPVRERGAVESQGWRVLGEYQPLDEREATSVAALRGRLEQLGAPGTERERIEFFRRSGELSARIDEVLAGRAPMLIALRPT